MQDLGSCAARREGSSPSFRIDFFRGVFFIAQKKPWRFGILKFSAEIGKARRYNERNWIVRRASVGLRVEIYHKDRKMQPHSLPFSESFIGR